ncbi:MAG: cupredoxin family protein [Pseudomonadota bacterium]
MNIIKKQVLAAFLTITALPFAFAAGSHGGGHGHGPDAVIGVAGDKNKVDRTINVSMTDDMRFLPSDIQAKQNETIRFIVKNDGKLKHEMVIGTEKELKEHYIEMMKNPEMEHDDPNQITLAPGKTGEIVWKFSKAGKVDFACLQPGHYDAGMKGKVAVTKAGANVKSGHAH